MLPAAERGLPAPVAVRSAPFLATLAGPGVSLDPGEMHVWDLPRMNDPGAWSLSGSAAARVVFLDRAGVPVLDVEGLPAEPLRLLAPASAARVVFACLGDAPTGPTGPAGPAGPARAGAVSLAAAPFGSPPTAGWQSGSLLTQVGPAVLLGRGATLRLPSPLGTRRDGYRTTEALVLAATAVARVTACETFLPAATDVVVVSVDSRSAAACLRAARGSRPAAASWGSRRRSWPAAG